MAPSRRRMRKGMSKRSKRMSKRMSKRFSRKMKGGVPNDLALSLQKRKKCWTDSCRLNEDKDILNYIETNPKEAINYQILNAALTGSKYQPLKTKLESITNKLKTPINISKVDEVTNIVKAQNEEDKMNALKNIIKLLNIKLEALNTLNSTNATIKDTDLINILDTNINDAIILYIKQYIPNTNISYDAGFIKEFLYAENYKIINENKDLFGSLFCNYNKILNKYNDGRAQKITSIPLYLEYSKEILKTACDTETHVKQDEEVNSNLTNELVDPGIELTNQDRPEVMVGGKQKKRRGKQSKRRRKQSKSRK